MKGIILLAVFLSACASMRRDKETIGKLTYANRNLKEEVLALKKKVREYRRIVGDLPKPDTVRTVCIRMEDEGEDICIDFVNGVAQ